MLALSPGAMVPLRGLTEKGASFGGNGSAPPSTLRTASEYWTSTGPELTSGNECERVWNIIVGRKGSVAVSHSTTA